MEEKGNRGGPCREIRCSRPRTGLLGRPRIASILNTSCLSHSLYDVLLLMEVDAVSPKRRSNSVTPIESSANGSNTAVTSSPSKLDTISGDADGSTRSPGNDRRSTLREQTRAEVSEYSETSDSSDDEAEDHRAAIRAGFDPTQMEDFEKQYFPEYVPYESDFINARNFILMMWKRKPTRFLPWSKISAGLSVRPTFDPIVSLCLSLLTSISCHLTEKLFTPIFQNRLVKDGARIYRFLMLRGHINVGMLEDTTAKTQCACQTGFESSDFVFSRSI